MLNNFHKEKYKGEGVMKKAVISVIMLFALFALSNTTTTLAKTNNEYETALQYYYKGEYEEAIRIFKDYAGEKPDSSTYYTALHK